MTKITKSKVLMLLIAITSIGILGTISFSATGNAQDDDDDSGGSWIWWQNSQSSEAKAIPDWVDQNFRWYGQGQITQTELLNAMKYLLDKNIMFISDEAAIEVQQLRDENIQLKIKLGEGEQLPSGDPFLQRQNEPSSYCDGMICTCNGADECWDSDFTNSCDKKTKLDCTDHEDGSYSCSCWQKTASVGADNPDVIIKSNASQPTSEIGGNPDVIIVGGYSALESDFDFASETVDDILRKGGGITHWDDEINSFSQQEMSESEVPELAGVVVLFNNAIDKKAQSIDAELKILEQWLEIISERQQSDSSDDESSRLAAESTTESAKDQTALINLNSEVGFITGKLSSIDQEIKALDTGIVVLEEKLYSVGDDAQLANIDLQNALQKQQQTLQTMSNVSKMLHDTAMAVIRNIG